MAEWLLFGALQGDLGEIEGTKPVHTVNSYRYVSAGAPCGPV
jgi:hypothetical protein